jgi:hypothetical protein
VYVKKVQQAITPKKKRNRDTNTLVSLPDVPHTGTGDSGTGLGVGDPTTSVVLSPHTTTDAAALSVGDCMRNGSLT